MSVVVNRNTLLLIEFANTPDYDPAEWLINPALPSCDRKYWKISDGEIVEMSPEEKAAADLPEIRAAKAAAIDAWYAAVLATGYPTGHGYSLAASISDQNRFTQDAVLQTNLMALEMASGSDIIGFLDAVGSPQGMTISAYIMMLAQYGQWCRNKLLTQASLLGQLAAASTIEDVEAIDPNA